VIISKIIKDLQVFTSFQDDYSISFMCSFQAPFICSLIVSTLSFAQHGCEGVNQTMKREKGM